MKVFVNTFVVSLVVEKIVTTLLQVLSSFAQAKDFILSWAGWLHWMFSFSLLYSWIGILLDGSLSLSLSIYIYIYIWKIVLFYGVCMHVLNQFNAWQFYHFGIADNASDCNGNYGIEGKQDCYKLFNQIKTKKFVNCFVSSR